MLTKYSHNLVTPLFIGIDVSPKGDVVIIYNIGMRGEAEAMLSHLGIYLAVIFGSIVWEAFTASYKVCMKLFQYYSVRNCAIEKDTLTIALDKSFDWKFAKCGFTDDVIEIQDEVEFNLRHQMTLHLFPHIVGILDDNKNDDSGSIRSNCLDSIIATSKKAPLIHIDYLIPLPKPITPQQSSVENEKNSHNEKPNEKADATKTLPTPTTKSSNKDTLSNRLEKSSED